LGEEGRAAFLNFLNVLPTLQDFSCSHDTLELHLNVTLCKEDFIDKSLIFYPTNKWEDLPKNGG
jgi:hypothetical protein